MPCGRRRRVHKAQSIGCPARRRPPLAHSPPKVARLLLNLAPRTAVTSPPHTSFFWSAPHPCWNSQRPSTAMAPPPPTRGSGEHATHSSAKRTLEDDIIDIDGRPSTTPIPSTKGKGPAKVRRADDPIDVDNPAAWTFPSPAAAGGTPSTSCFQPMLKFSGALGIALYEKKVEVRTEEATAAAAVTDGAPSKISGACETDSTPVTISDGASAVGVATEAGGAPPDTPVDTPQGEFVNTVPEAVPPQASPKAKPPVRTLGFRSKWDRSILPRPGRKSKFVRRSAVITAPSVARMIAGPPTPPHSGSDSEGGSNDGD